jgi:hypothetical protein
MSLQGNATYRHLNITRIKYYLHLELWILAFEACEIVFSLLLNVCGMSLGPSISNQDKTQHLVSYTQKVCEFPQDYVYWIIVPHIVVFYRWHTFLLHIIRNVMHMLESIWRQKIPRHTGAEVWVLFSNVLSKSYAFLNTTNNLQTWTL